MAVLKLVGCVHYCLIPLWKCLVVFGPLEQVFASGQGFALVANTWTTVQHHLHILLNFVHFEWVDLKVALGLDLPGIGVPLLPFQIEGHLLSYIQFRLLIRVKQKILRFFHLLLLLDQRWPAINFYITHTLLFCHLLLLDAVLLQNLRFLWCLFLLRWLDHFCKPLRENIQIQTVHPLREL